MKIQCDVCNKAAASMFCVADEAALCVACDHRVHHANKLAGKHLRFSLLQPSPKQAPLCDICQERRAFLFCQEDRAILCRECDYPIHKANEHTQKHNRFLLTGLRLSATSTLYSSSPSVSPASSSITNKPQINSTNKRVSSLSSSASAYQGQASVAKTTAMSVASTATPPAPPPPAATVNDKDGDDIQSTNNDSASSISEYFMEMLAGWQVEDLFDSASLNGFSKASDNDVQSFWDYNLGKNTYSFTGKNSASLWVPQVPPRPLLATPTTQSYPCTEIAFGAQIGFKDSINGAANFKPSMKRSDDNSFAVPQICPPSTPFKRSRNLL